MGWQLLYKLITHIRWFLFKQTGIVLASMYRVSEPSVIAVHIRISHKLLIFNIEYALVNIQTQTWDCQQTESPKHFSTRIKWVHAQHAPDCLLLSFENSFQVALE